MRFRARKFAHVLERIGLAMAGAACGLFVSAHVGSSIGALTSQAFLLAMMVAGAVAFYLGIDTPQLAFHGDDDPDVDAAELLTSVGTFLATLAAFVSVGIIILREEPHIALTWLIFACWVFGIAMQIVAGAKARMRR
jgi:mannose/fructose/N-acetylgalactosamine-specific phosphotransferase system component IID